MVVTFRGLQQPARLEIEQMTTRTEALETARAQYSAWIAADIEHLFRGAPEPKGSDFGYRHGWVTVGGFAFGTDEMVGPNNQPYMD
jgi:hypothetical protein